MEHAMATDIEATHKCYDDRAISFLAAFLIWTISGSQAVGNIQSLLRSLSFEAAPEVVLSAISHTLLSHYMFLTLYVAESTTRWGARNR